MYGWCLPHQVLYLIHSFFHCLIRGRQSKICFVTLLWLTESHKKVIGTHIAKRKNDDEDKEDEDMEDCEYMDVDEDQDEEMEVDIGINDETTSW